MRPRQNAGTGLDWSHHALLGDQGDAVEIDLELLSRKKFGLETGGEHRRQARQTNAEYRIHLFLHHRLLEDRYVDVVDVDLAEIEACSLCQHFPERRFSGVQHAADGLALNILELTNAAIGMRRNAHLKLVGL